MAVWSYNYKRLSRIEGIETTILIRTTNNDVMCFKHFIVNRDYVLINISTYGVGKHFVTVGMTYIMV